MFLFTHYQFKSQNSLHRTFPIANVRDYRSSARAVSYYLEHLVQYYSVFLLNLGRFEVMHSHRFSSVIFVNTSLW